MTEEEFIKYYTDSHMAMKVTDVLEKGSFKKSNLMTYQPGDKGISPYKPIPGKKMIESKAMEKRYDGIKHVLLDAFSAKIPNLMDVPVEKLAELALKAMPKQLEGRVEHAFTFVDMVKMSKAEIVDVEDAESE